LIASAEPDSDQLEELGEALEGSQTRSAAGQLVDLHFFCGFGFGEIASMRGVSERTVQRDWRKARLLLHRVMQDDPADAGSDRGAEEIDR
jgi:DNA-directed RNA polymerase specialized sigma24 family protein